MLLALHFDIVSSFRNGQFLNKLQSGLDFIPNFKRQDCISQECDLL